MQPLRKPSFAFGNPATLSSDTEDLGQWLCVPPFRMVCRFGQFDLN